MGVPQKYKRTLLLWIGLAFISGGTGHTEFCTKSGTDPIMFLNDGNCPYGALFPTPVTVDCLATSESESIIADMCTNQAVSASGEGPFQVQYFPSAGAPALDPSATCAGTNKCGKKGYASEWWVRNIADPEIPRFVPAWPETSQNPEKLVDDQTKRLFRNLMGLATDENAGESNLRITTLLKKSFEIATKFCGNNRFFPPEFADDVLSAFTFLLTESDTSRIVDIPLEEYRIIDLVLNRCLDRNNPFKIEGNLCETKAEIKSIKTPYKTIWSNPQTDFSWHPEKYDVPVDATWATMDFVHGMCYGFFKEHVNSHHLFEQAVEKLFTPEMLFRWDKPTVLGLQDHWDNFFSANVRSTIYNLEFCTAAAYESAPFLHRLERMLVKYADSNSTAPAPTAPRTKRSTMQIPPIRDQQFFCFDSPEKKEDVLAKWKVVNCPGATATG